jgi:serpin B
MVRFRSHIPTMKAALLVSLLAMPALAADPAATAINELGLDLHRRLAGAKNDANLCVSPYSIQCALAMTYAGADGATREEMARVLHYPKGDAIHESLPALNKALTAISEKTAKMAADAKKWGGDGEPVTFNLANRLFGQDGYSFHAPFLAQLKDTYHAPLEKMDFSKSAAATKHINGWVEEETKKRIRDLLPDGVLNADTRLVLVNAVYLKAPWAEKFYAESTKPKPFHIAGGENKDVPTMMRHDHFGYAKREGYTAVTIPYYGGDVHFLVFVPDDVRGLADVEKKLTPAALADCAKLPYKDVILHLPKFKIEGASISLADELRGLGMKTAFDDPQGSANFSRMAARTPSDYLYISEVIHKTFIALDEKGTEAAAATAVMMRAGSAAPVDPPKPIEVKVDRPFLFAIQHAPTGACLFLGRVTDPR